MKWCEFGESVEGHGDTPEEGDYLAAASRTQGDEKKYEYSSALATS